MRACSISLASSACACSTSAAERCPCRLHLARGVGARLFGIPGQVAPEFLVLADELRPCLLGFTGELGRQLPGLGRLVARHGLDFRRFALALGADRRRFAFRAGAHFGGFGRDGAADGRSLAERVAGLCFCFGVCARKHFLGLGIGTIEYCLRLVIGIGNDALRGLRRLTTHRLDLALNAAAQPFGVDVRLADQAGGLLLGHPERFLQLRAESAIGRTSGLLDLRLQIVDSGLEALDLFGRFRLVAVGLDQLPSQPLHRTVDLVAVITAHRGRK